MPIAEYPFIEDLSWSPTWRPHLPIEVVNPDNGAGILAFGAIDTGANACYMPFEYAREMDIELQESNKIQVDCADVNRDGYKHIVEMRVFGIVGVSEDEVYVPDNVVIHWPTIEVIFLRDLKNPRLGVKGFLDTYALIMNYQKKKFSLLIPTKDKPCPICQPPKKSTLS